MFWKQCNIASKVLDNAFLIIKTNEEYDKSKLGVRGAATLFDYDGSKTDM